MDYQMVQSGFIVTQVAAHFHRLANASFMNEADYQKSGVSA